MGANKMNVNVFFRRHPCLWPRLTSSNMEPMKKKLKLLVWCVCVCLYFIPLFRVNSQAHTSLGLSPQSSFVGAIAIGDLVKSTLGPKGMVSYLFVYFIPA